MSDQMDRSDRGVYRLVQEIIDNTSSVIYVKDLAFRYQLINRQFEKLFGISRTEISGKTDYEVFPPHLADGFRTNDVLVAETGRSIECEEVAPHNDELHTYLTLKFPLRDALGQIEAVAGISTDVTERLRTRREMESLKRRYEQILESVTDGICGLDEHGNVMFLKAAAERLLGWSIADLQGDCRSTIIVPPDGSSSRECLVAAILRGEEQHRTTEAKFRCKDGTSIPVEYVASPIRESDRIVGVVIAFHDLTERIANLRVEQELKTAHKVQRALYPQTTPIRPGMDIAGISIPSRFACGDYYDYLPTDDGSLVVVVGDVSGHGVGPALQMVGVRASLRAIAAGEHDPGKCLSRLNRVLYADLPDEMFVTMLIARIERFGKSLSYSAAGHEGLLVRCDGQTTRLPGTGLVLGPVESTHFDVCESIPLNPGDIVLIPTDGLIETMSPDYELFGWNRAADVIIRNRRSSAASILEELRAVANRFSNGAALQDDVTAVVVKILPE